MSVAAAAALAVCCTTACYTYTALPEPSPAPGARVAVSLTDWGSRQLTRALGSDVVAVRGRYLGANESGLRVAVSSVELRSGHESSWRGEIVIVPANYVMTVEERHLAMGRSVLLAGVAGLAVAAGTVAVSGSGFGAGVGPKGGAR